MKKSLKDLSKNEISEIIEESLSDYCFNVARSGNKPCGKERNISWVKTCPSVWPNFILNINFTEEKIGDQIEQVITQINTGDLPDEWIIGPKKNPVDLCEYLIKYGFVKKYEMSGMAIDLSKLDEKVSIPQNVRIQIVDNIELLKIWTEIVSNGLFKRGVIELCLFEDLLKDKNFKFYIAFLDGIAVASSMLQISGDIATIDMVAILPECRRLGIGTAMTLMPLIDAHEMGYNIGVLQASQAGEPVYRKIGFEEYCRFGVFKYFIS